MSSGVDLFLYEIAHARQQELLEAARASRALEATEPSLAGLLRALGKRFGRRMTFNPAPPVLEGASHQTGCDAVCCQRLRARKDAA